MGAAEIQIGKRDFLKLSGSALGYLAGSVTARNVIYAAGGLEGINAFLNARRTVESLKHVLEPNPPYDAIVVLGAGNAFDKGSEVPSLDGQLRVIAGVEGYLKKSTKLIRFAGGSQGGTPEAKIMAEYATSYAILPVSIISAETESTDTVSNLLQIREWKKKNPDIRKIGVSTNAYHMRGVQVLGKNLGLDLYPVVAERILVDTGKPDLIAKVKDLYADPSFQSRIDKEQARLAMLLIDPESHVSHERPDWQRRMPFLKPGFDIANEALRIVGERLVPLEIRPVI